MTNMTAIVAFVLVFLSLIALVVLGVFISQILGD